MVILLETELGIRLEDDIQVLGMLKSNPRVDQQQVNSAGGDRTLAFQYRARYSIRYHIAILICVFTGCDVKRPLVLLSAAIRPSCAS